MVTLYRTTAVPVSQCPVRSQAVEKSLPMAGKPAFLSAVPMASVKRSAILTDNAVAPDLKNYSRLQNLALAANVATLFINAYNYSQSLNWLFLGTTATYAFTTLISWLNVWQTRSAMKYVPPPKSPVLPAARPPVALTVTAVNEPGLVVNNTLLALSRVNYANADIYLLDDSAPGSAAASEYRQIVATLKTCGVKINHLRRKDDPAAFHDGFKAGNMNHFLNIFGRNYKYFASFDADFRPNADFLDKTVSVMESPKGRDISILQTGQQFEGGSEPIVRANGAIDAVNYDLLGRAREALGVAFWYGSSALIRIEDLFKAAEIRGTPDQPVRMQTLTEDQDTSIGLKEVFGRNKTSYLDEYASTGLDPSTLVRYLKQHRRWAIGGTQLLFKRILPMAINDMKRGEYRTAIYTFQDFLYRLTPLQHFFLAFGGLALLACFGSPIASSLLMTTSLTAMGLTYLPAFYRGTKRGARLSDIINQLDLFVLSTPMHVEAMIKSASSKRLVFETTNVSLSGRERLPLKWLVPNLAALGINLGLFFMTIGNAVAGAIAGVNISFLMLIVKTVFLLNNIRIFGALAEFNDGWKATFSDLWVGFKQSFNNIGRAAISALIKLSELQYTIFPK